MTIVLLLLIYLIFISLGLPDSIIGTTWPALSTSLNIPEDYQGILTCSISLCTIISSFFSTALIKKFKTGPVVCGSIILTVVGLIIFSISPNFWIMLIAALPLGLGAGAIDAALNNYVALHYNALHMNWLHASWGIGATISPMIVSSFISSENLNGWRTGGLILAGIQAAIFIISLTTLPLWKKSEKIFTEREKDKVNEEESKADIGFIKTFKIRGIWFALIAFLAYISVESLTGMWFSSMVHFGLVDSSGNSLVDESTAALWGSFFYLGVTAGRFIAGPISLKVNERFMIRIGESFILIGIILLFMQFNIILMPIAVVLMGLGCGPVYPAIIRDTVRRFTKTYSQNVMGVQMSFAYIANFLIAPLFGVIAKATTFLILPYILIAFFILLVFGNETINFLVKRKPTFNVN